MPTPIRLVYYGLAGFSSVKSYPQCRFRYWCLSSCFAVKKARSHTTHEWSSSKKSRIRSCYNFNRSKMSAKVSFSRREWKAHQILMGEEKERRASAVDNLIPKFLCRESLASIVDFLTSLLSYLALNFLDTPPWWKESRKLTLSLRYFCFSRQKVHLQLRPKYVRT